MKNRTIDAKKIKGVETPRQVAFVELMYKLENKNRRRGQYAPDKNYFYGYHSGLKFTIYTWIQLALPGRERVIEFVKKERDKIEAERMDEKDRKIRLREGGCIQSFHDVLAELAKGDVL